MSPSANIEYHLRELRIAQDPASPLHIMPTLHGSEHGILDVGCGIGQTLLACDEQPGRVLVGIDVDRECLRYGRKNFGSIAFACASAEYLPFRSRTFDMVISRVALPYTVLVKSLPEISRVLNDGGRIWLTLHPVSKTIRRFLQSLRRFAIKDVIFQSYVVVNGLSLHWFGRQFRFPVNGRCESFQTIAGMKRLLEGAGFSNIEFQRGEHFVCTAHKGRTVV